MISLSKEYLVFSCVILASVYNSIVFGNKFVSFLLLSSIMYYFYVMKIAEKEKQNISSRNDEIDKIIESFKEKNEKLSYINTDIYSIFRKPKRFKYLKLNRVFDEDLINIQFLRDSDDYLYFTFFVILEYFLKHYYDALLEKDIIYNLDLMITLHTKVKTMYDETKIGVFGPKSVSSNVSLLKTGITNILKKMTYKIAIIKNISDI